MRILVESVACSVRDAKVAQEAGAHRIELCAAIELGGLTPSIGLVQEVLANCDLPVMAMVRPRPGDFTYGDAEIKTMVADARALVAAGVHGIVFGGIDARGFVDRDCCATLVEAADSQETVFHRAFDDLADPDQGLATLQSLGIDRVLTSGGADTALEGAARIRRFGTSAIQVVAAGGIRAENVLQVIEAAGVSQVHLGPFKKTAGGSLRYRQPKLDLDGIVLGRVVRLCSGRDS